MKKTTGKRRTSAKKATLKANGRTRESKLSERDIFDGALRLIRSDGVENLSMRRLAVELNVTPMAVYYYVKNRHDLLERIYDSMLASVPTPAPVRERWREQFRELALSLYDLYARHHGLAAFTLGRPRTVQGRRIVRYQIELLLAAGFDDRDAALALSALNTVIFGTLGAQQQLSTEDNKAVNRKRRTLPSSALGRVAVQLAELRFDEWSKFAIDTVLSSLALRLAPSGSRKRARPKSRA